MHYNSKTRRLVSNCGFLYELCLWMNSLIVFENIDHWKHIKSEDNPADIPSRGCTPQEIVNNKLLWHVPHWLIFLCFFGRSQGLGNKKSNFDLDINCTDLIE